MAQYRIYGKIEGGTLTALSFTGEEEGGERGLIDACLELFLEKSREELEGISFREVENFLREENHLPAFPSNESMSAWFTLTKQSFMRALRLSESPIVCTCFKVSYKAIEDELVARPHLEDLIENLKVSSTCGACLRVGKGKRFAYLEDIYRGVLAKIKRGYYESEEYKRLDGLGLSSLGDESCDPPLSLQEHGPFEGLSLLKKVQLVELVLEKKVRPFLRRDGGDVKLLDIRDSAVLVTYEGSCGQCASATEGTLEFMIKTLNEQFQASGIDVIVDSS
ncbi:MAG: NifU family protein [Bacteriovoracales bacterium]|nr:NifU family protein [Bacteriovoracales bacterium]